MLSASNQSQSQTQTPLPTMSKTLFRNKPSSILSDALLFIGGASVAFLLVWTLWSCVNPNPSSSGFSYSPDPETTVSEAFKVQDCADGAQGVNLREDPPASTFYDDPNLSYSIEKPIKNWDEKRRIWLNHHPSFAAGVSERILLVTGSQMKPCRNPIGDNLLLRFFKNKVDYCRLHGYDIFYNNALFQPKMSGCWAKIPLVRAAMVAHPESEWIWWVDSDAAFTDMEFKIPLERYEDHNFILHGWAREIFDTNSPSWVGLNAGIFLIRNCQWSLDFMDAWASMGPLSPKYDTWGKILKSTFKDKVFDDSDDQSALVYLMLKERKKWADKIYLEKQYYFEGYFLEIMGRLDNITENYVEIERGVRKLRRRHAEKVSEYYAGVREPHLKKLGIGYGSWRRPFITHFAGCQPCSGKHNSTYSDESCWKGMERALNFADNQVLRNFGLVRRDLLDSSPLEPLPFDAAFA
ncbi:Galactosyl transferase [Macleaya cordata]|uniref:Galactosyl transferase n=1 Tax=Macleaya cordata TaxID=56857 RepID=A0A200Q0I9_MACCD|nr:Galactosyl transferase [Macleaya cordata]